MQHYNGFLLVNKQPDLSSHATLGPLKRFFQCKIGHTGTLDPMATGMLVCAVGQARKFIQYTQSQANKCYQATVQLGLQTTTSDITGEILDQQTVPPLELQQIVAAFTNLFSGRITQTPPIYSALKYQGKPYYHYARRGINIPIASREVTIHQTEAIQYDTDTQQIHFRTLVSAGTYIRTLAVDLAQSLGTIGCLSALHRCYVSPWDHAEAHTVDTIIHAEHNDCYLQPIESALGHIPKITLDDTTITRLMHGLQSQISTPAAQAGMHCIFSAQGKFQGLADVHNACVTVVKMLHPDANHHD